MKRNVHAFRIHRFLHFYRGILLHFCWGICMGILGCSCSVFFYTLQCIALQCTVGQWVLTPCILISETLFYTLMESAVCILGWQYTVFFLRHHCSLWIGIMYSWMEAHVSMTRGVSQGRVDSSTLTLEIPAESLQ